MSNEKLSDLKDLTEHWRSNASIGKTTPRSHAGWFLYEACSEIDRLRAENAEIRKTMAGMVCGTCNGTGVAILSHAPVCQPSNTDKKENNES